MSGNIYYVTGATFSPGQFAALDKDNALVHYDRTVHQRPFGVAAEPICKGCVVRVDNNGEIHVFKYPETKPCQQEDRDHLPTNKL